MFGAIIGDIVGSVYEFDNHKSKEFELFKSECCFTDDTTMTIAIAHAILKCKDDFSELKYQAVKSMRGFGKMYPGVGYGMGFYDWLTDNQVKVKDSYGNGAAMRVSPVAYVAKNINQVKQLSHYVTCISHNHKQGLKGAEATAVAIFLALQGKTKQEIKTHIEDNYYKLDFTIDSIRDSYQFNETCQQTVPQAIQAFLEGESFEDCVRTAVSLGGDSDTLTCITASIAGAFYDIPNHITQKALTYLDKDLIKIINMFEKKYIQK